MRITLEQLETAGACSEQRKLFEQLFGSEVGVTEELCVRYASKFDWDWARCLLTAPAEAEYDRVVAPARAEYDRVTAAAWAEYNRVVAPAEAEYDRVTAAAWAEYNRVAADAWAKTYNSQESEAPA